MKVKTLRIWLFLLPVIGIIGVLLYVQATNNQRELENQLLRSMEASKNDIVRALSDYYDRVDAYFMQHGASIAAKSLTTKEESNKLTIINPFKPAYSNGRILNEDFQPKDSLFIKNGAIYRKDLKVKVDKIIDELNKQNILKPLQIRDERKNAVDQNSDVSLVVDLEIPIFELLRKQETNKIFERFFLTDKVGNIVYPDTEYGVSLFQPTDLKIDTLGVTHAGASMVPIKFSEKESRAYISPIQINSLKLYAVGVISEDTHQKVGLRLNFTVLSILLLFLMVLIALIPILGIMNLSKGDNLTQDKVTKVGISLLLLTVIIGFASAQFKNKPDDIGSKKTLVDSLSASLEDSLTFYQDKLESMIKSNNWTSKESNYNELIWFRDDGFVRKIFYRGKDETLDFQDAPSSVDLSTRIYYSYFYDQRNVNNRNGFFLNSHYSRFDGELESVISKNFYANDENEKGVRAITFRLNTDPSISENYRFLVFKKTGKILLKSKKITSPIDNIEEGISPEKWLEISSLMENNTNSHQQIRTSLYLNGYQYNGILKKISGVNYDQDIWMLFLVNTNLSHSYASLVSAESLLFVLVYFLSLIFSLIIQKNSRRFKNKHGTKSFLFSWLEPTESNLPHLTYLTLCHACYGILLLIIYYNCAISHIYFLVLMIFSGFLVSLVNLSTSIGTDPSLDQTEFKLKKYSVRTLILGGIVVMLFLWIALQIHEIVIPALLLLLISSGFILAWFFLVKPVQKLLFVRSRVMTLPMFLGVWFLIIGFLPGYFIMSKTQQFEQTVWDKQQLTLKKVALEEDIDHTHLYEESRRNWLSLIADPFDSKISNFIAPNIETIHDAVRSPQKLNPTLKSIFQNGTIASVFFIMFVLLTKQLQSIIFFPILVLKTKPTNLHSKRIFITCPDSALILNYVKQHISQIDNLEIIDLSMMVPFADITLNPVKSIYLFINFHCRKDKLEVINLIGKKDFKGKQMIMTSGKTWHETFSTIENIDDRILFAETFSDYEFLILPLDASQYSSEYKGMVNPLYLQAKNEEELQLSTAKFADIWSELNFQEKLVCHEFALERFLNKARLKTIHELFKKGLLAEKDAKPNSPINHSKTEYWKRYEFFSRLFQIYLLTYVSEEEIKSFSEFESKNGNAHLIQVSALSFVLICFALIGFFNRSFFDQIYAYLTGSVGLIGSIYTILNSGIANFKFGKPKA